MIAPIVFAALITAVTVWYLVRPLRRAAGPTQEGYYQIVQLRERLLAQLRELDVEANDNNIDVKIAADERLRLEGELAAVLKELEGLGAASEGVAQVAMSPRLWQWVFLALAVALPVVSAGLYVVKNGVTLTRLADPVAVVQPQVPPMVLEMVARLERRLTEQPADPQGWARLGRAYDVLGRQEEAGQAYAHAHRLAPNDAEILSAYAAHLMAADPINPSPEAVALFRKLHTLDPRHPGALWTLGLLAYKEQKFKEAGKYWERLLKELPADSEVAPAVRQALDAARMQAAGKKK